MSFKGTINKQGLIFLVETNIILSPYGGDDADEDDVS